MCFGCGKPGHKIYECLAKNLLQAPKSQRQGRVFTMDAAKASESKGLIQGTCEVDGETLTVIYDLGALHSFISHDCVTVL